jgi:hypothetical protein
VPIGLALRTLIGKHKILGVASGSYAAIVRRKNTTTGNALVEVYMRH